MQVMIGQSAQFGCHLDERFCYGFRFSGLEESELLYEASRRAWSSSPGAREFAALHEMARNRPSSANLPRRVVPGSLCLSVLPAIVG